MRSKLAAAFTVVVLVSMVSDAQTVGRYAAKRRSGLASSSTMTNNIFVLFRLDTATGELRACTHATAACANSAVLQAAGVMIGRFQFMPTETMHDLNVNRGLDAWIVDTANGQMYVCGVTLSNATLQISTCTCRKQL